MNPGRWRPCCLAFDSFPVNEYHPIVPTESPLEITAKADAVRKAASAVIPAWGGRCDLNQGPQAVSLPVLAKGKGAVVTDVDGREYIDFDCGNGTLLLGHADERIVVAINKAAAKGADLGFPSEAHVRLAEMLASRLPGTGWVWLLNSPAWAVLVGVDLARRLTDRTAVLVFDGWEGQGLAGLATGGSGKDLYSCAFNRIAAVRQVFKRHPGRIAGVVVEPVALGRGLVVPDEGFLVALRDLCDKHESLLVFDERRTGLSVGLGGAAGVIGVEPDLTLLGCGLGASLPLAAIGGRRKLLKTNFPANPLLTVESSAHALSLAAGLAVLHASGEEGFYESLTSLARELSEGLERVAAEVGVPVRTVSFGNLVGLSFVSDPGQRTSDVTRSDACRHADFHRAMLERGILLPAPPAPWFVSAAHQKDHCDQAMQSAGEALRIAVGAA